MGRGSFGIKELMNDAAHRQTGRPPLHAVLLAALAGGHGLVGGRGTGLRAERVLGELLRTQMKRSGESFALINHQIHFALRLVKCFWGSLDGAPEKACPTIQEAVHILSEPSSDPSHGLDLWPPNPVLKPRIFLVIWLFISRLS